MEEFLVLGIVLYMAFLKSESPAPLRVTPGILAPLNNSVFAALFAFGFVSNIGTWVQDIGASWLMTSLAPSPLMVSLIQTAENLPYFFLEYSRVRWRISLTGDAY